MSRRCPADCVYPNIHRSRFRLKDDWWRLLCLQRPHRCVSCGFRFYRTSRLMLACVLLLGFLVIYPLSYYQVAEQYSANPTVKSLYVPLLWVEEQVLSSSVPRDQPRG